MELLPKMQGLFNSKEITWILANAKFDMHMLDREGLKLLGNIYDVLVMARLECNTHMMYSLAACASRIKLEKSNAVEEWVKKKKAYKMIPVPGKKTKQKEVYYHNVPLEIISEYGCLDAKITLDLSQHQKIAFKKYSDELNEVVKRPWDVLNNEMALTKVCFNMEKRGILLDVAYVKAALVHEEALAAKAAQEFKDATGRELVDSFKALKEAFDGLGIEAGITEKGQVSYTEEVLSKSEHKAAKSVLSYREANKKASTYYSAFLYHADKDGIVHCNIRQSATATGRFSISDPALQTLTSEDELISEWKVRKSFIPRPGFSFFAIDYKAFEFRAMVDTAGEKELAAKIEAGLDPHQAAADLTGVTRKQAKTLGFGLLYGMGVQKLSAALGLSLEEGKKVRNKYFEALPKVQEFIRAASWKAEKNKFVVNRFGRPYFFPDTKFSYKAANCLIQGGTAEAIKFAMVKIDAFLEPYLSKMVLQIHDELLFEIHDTEHHLVPGVQKIMEEIWPSRIHKMGCSVDWSKKSWGELEEYGDKTGNIISSEGSSKIKDTSEYVDISYPTGVNQGHTGLANLL